MKYYLGGYSLIKLRMFKEKRKIYTCSSCINDSFYYPDFLFLNNLNESHIDKIKKDLKIDRLLSKKIENWSCEKLNQHKIGFSELFFDIETVVDYSSRFFSDIDNKIILKILFSEYETNSYLNEFINESNEFSVIYSNLTKKIIDNDNLKNEKFIGFDLIGVEFNESTLHSFHCHDLSNELIEKFGVELNEFGLIKSIEKPVEIIDFMNDENNGFEPVPWFLVKIKLVQK